MSLGAPGLGPLVTGRLVAGHLVAGRLGPASLTPPTAMGSQLSTPYPIPAPAVQPEPCPPPPLPPGPPPPPLPSPAVPTSRVPLVKAAPTRRVSLAAVAGKGIWVTDFPGGHVDVAQVVATARLAHLNQIWVRTGSSQDGFYGGPLLRQLVPAAHAAGISVVAWDFPTLSDPAADAVRALDALRAGADAFSPDIEAAAEGTYLSVRRARYYLSLVRHYAGSHPVIATVPVPDSYWVKFYPYKAEAPFVNAFAPMVYWDCTKPNIAVEQAIHYLAPLRPVAPIGQDFNMASEGGRHGLPSPLEIWSFLYAAHRFGAVGASLYDIEDGGLPQLEALAAYPWRPSGLVSGRGRSRTR